MKKFWIFLISLIIIITCFIGISKVFQSTQIRVDSFNAEIVIDENGDMIVEEEWVTLWPKGKSVAFRDIGYQKYNPNNPLHQNSSNVARFDNNSVLVKVYDSNNNELSTGDYRVGYSFKGDEDELGYPIECYPNRQDCESIFVQVYGGMERKMMFKYQYKIIGAITEYKDIAELNWVLLEYFESGINSSKVTIKVPSSNSQLRAWGHGLSRGVILPPTDKEVILEMKDIKSSELIEFRVLIPASAVSVDSINYIDQNMENEIVQYENQLAIETNKRIIIAQIIFYGVFLMVLLMLLITYKAYHKYDKEHIPKFTGKYFRELPAEYTPAEMSYLFYFRKINDEDVTATLLDLIRREYITLDNNGERVNAKDPNFKIILNKEKNQNQLLSHEKHLIYWFFGVIGNGEEEVTLKQIENYPKASYQQAMRFQQEARRFVVKAKEAGNNHDFFETKLGQAKSKLFMVSFIPIIYLIISLFTAASYQINNLIPIIISIITFVIYIIYVSSIDKRSINGNEDYAKWKAFKEFLLDFGRMEDYPMPGIVVWEHYMVYATSLKIADKVMEQLQVKLPDITNEESFSQSTFIGFGYRYYGFRFGYSLSRINRTMSTARSNGNATITAYQASKVGGIGRGGGFGGGRSFGGGGGGFRGR